MTTQTRPRINRDRPRPRTNRDAESPAHGAVRQRNRREDLNFLKISQVAERLGVATRTVRRWIDDGGLIPHRFGGVVRIAENDLRAFLALHRDS